MGKIWAGAIVIVATSFYCLRGSTAQLGAGTEDVVKILADASSASGQWPNATNTGVPTDVKLIPSSGDLIVTEAGTVISGLDIQGSVYINGPIVKLMNSRVTSSGFAVVKIAPITGTVIQDCEINGTGGTYDGNSGNQGIEGHGTFVRNNIYGVENGILIEGDGSVIQDNYIHELLAKGSTHYDGLQIDGGVSNTTIRHNTIINSHDSTSAIMIDNQLGPVSNVVVDNNLLVGGAFTVYSDAKFNGNPITGVSFTNNHLGRGQYGFRLFRGNSPTYTGNVNDGARLVQTLN